MEAEIGPILNLQAPSAVMQELIWWGDAYRRLMYFYLNEDGYWFGERQSQSALPLFIDEKAVYEPTSIDLDDERPIVETSDGYFYGIHRRRINHIVRFDVPEAAHDDDVIRSGFVHLARDITAKLKDWYKALPLPVRQECTIEELVEGKEREKINLAEGNYFGTPTDRK